MQYGKDTAVKLYDSSYQSQAYLSNSASLLNDDVNKVSVLTELYTMNALVQNNMVLEEELKEVKRAVSTPNAESINGYSNESKYSKGYREYMHQMRTLLGCSPFLYPEGYAMKIPCTSREIHLPPGRLEDMLLFLCHNHPLFSCFYFMDGSKLGAHGMRILYIGKDVVVFVLYQFTSMILQYFMLDGYGLGTLINLFIITPSAVTLGLLLKYLYTCPFTETVEFQHKYAKYQSAVLFLGRLAIVPIMLIMCGSLIIACLFSSGRRIAIIIVNFFLYVQLYGVLLAIGKSVLLFVDNYYYQLTVCGILNILCVGKLYKERVVAEQMVVNVDYAYRVSRYLHGFITVETILNRSDAIKAKWITETVTHVCDIEMKGAMSSGDTDRYVVQIPVEPPRNSFISMDAIYGTNDDDNKEEEGAVVGANNIDSRDLVSTVENPIHSTIASYPTDSLHLQQSVINHSNEVSDDAALYEEYQSLQSQHDDTIYSMTNDTEEVISFEEWKIKRKQFKQGTRGSFVKAFQVFESCEQLSSKSHSAPSASVQNTMHLHSAKVKKPFNTTRKV